MLLHLVRDSSPCDARGQRAPSRNPRARLAPAGFGRRWLLTSRADPDERSRRVTERCRGSIEASPCRDAARNPFQNFVPAARVVREVDPGDVAWPSRSQPALLDGQERPPSKNPRRQSLRLRGKKGRNARSPNPVLASLEGLVSFQLRFPRMTSSSTDPRPRRPDLDARSGGAGVSRPSALAESAPTVGSRNSSRPGHIRETDRTSCRHEP